MKNLMKLPTLLAVCLILLLCATGCDVIPRKVYEIKTVDGQTLKLYCPEINRGRSALTYLYEGDCVLVED